MRFDERNVEPEGRKPYPRTARRVLRPGRQIATESQETRFGGGGPPALLKLRFVELAATGVSPGTKVMSCEECELLLRQQCDAVDRWRELLKELSNTALCQESGAFGSAWEQASDAQSQVARTRNAYKLHLATHRVS